MQPPTIIPTGAEGHLTTPVCDGPGGNETSHAWTVCLDLEGTLISSAVSQFPRPGLRAFLEGLAALEVRLWLFTSVPEAKVRAVLQTLVAEQDAPAWAADLPVVPWSRTASTKRLEDVPGATIDRTLLVDDLPLLPPEQRRQWVEISGFDGTQVEDTELPRALQEVRRRVGQLAKEGPPARG